MVGLPETTVKEARDRVRSAIINSGYEYPAKKSPSNWLQPICQKKGGRYDFTYRHCVAGGLRAAYSQWLDEYELVGELALTGALRGVPAQSPRYN